MHPRGTRRIAVAALILAAASCGRRSPAVPDLDTAAESYVRLVLALAERDPDALDSYRGPAAWRADAQALRARLPAIEKSARGLADALASHAANDETRRDFLVRQLRAVAERAAIVNGARPPFDEEAFLLFGIQRGSTGSKGSKGSTGSPGSSGSESAPGPVPDERPFVIPRQRVRAVLAAAVDGCRSRTAAHIPLPPSERVSVEYVPDLAWSAFTDYQGGFHSRIRVNARMPLTVDGALELACHEAYPGHHTIDVLIESRFGDRRPELLVEPLFSPQALLHEGAASVAPSLAFSEAERIAFERDRLFPLAGLDPADAERSVRAGAAHEPLRAAELAVLRRYLDGALDFPRASQALADLAPGSAADDALKFANRFRTYVATYVVGRERAAAWLDAHASPDDPAARWRAYVDLVSSASQAIR